MHKRRWRSALRLVMLSFACLLLVTVSRAQPAAHGYRFEVASIRPSDPTGRVAGMPGPAFTPGRYRRESNSLWGLAAIAFNKKHAFELVCPDWMVHAHFTIDATVPAGATKADVPIMVQHLLEDRFALKYHHETRQINGYELVVVTSGSKLKKSAGPPDTSAAKGFGFEKSGVVQFDKNSGPEQLYVSMSGGQVSWWHGRDETMQRLAADLSDRLEVPVVDDTGLSEKYDFLLNFIEENTSTAAAGGASPPSDYPPLREALKEQLGLELRPAKNVPVDIVVIDSANKEPTEN